jgi:hypothetical protein
MGVCVCQAAPSVHEADKSTTHTHTANGRHVLCILHGILSKGVATFNFNFTTLEHSEEGIMAWCSPEHFLHFLNDTHIHTHTCTHTHAHTHQGTKHLVIW